MLTIGVRGSGKTLFNIFIIKKIAQYSPVAILDTKGEDEFTRLPGHFLIESIDDMTRWKPREKPILVYRPQSSELVDYDLLDDFLQWVYETGDVYTYIDELSSLNQHRKPRMGLTNLISRGRKHKKHGRIVRSPLGMSTQRPRNIPAMCYTEASRVVCFALNNLADRKHVVDFTHEKMIHLPEDRYGFRVYDSTLRDCIQCTRLQGVA